MAALGAAGRSWDYPEGVVVRLRGVLELSWGRFGCVLGSQEAVFEASWDIVGRCGDSNGGKMRDSILLAICSSTLNEIDFQKSSDAQKMNECQKLL